VLTCAARLDTPIGDASDPGDAGRTNVCDKFLLAKKERVCDGRSSGRRLPSKYRELSSTWRGLLPAMKSQDSRGDLQRLAADYDRLAKFSDARRRLIEEHKRRAMLKTFASHRAEMETLFEEFDRSVADAVRIRRDFIRIELELGCTFLDSAKARGPLGSQGCIRSAVKALRTANRFLAMLPRLNDAAVADIYQRRDELQQRLRDIFAEH